MDDGSIEVTISCQGCGKFILKTRELGWFEVVRVWCEVCYTLKGAK